MSKEILQLPFKDKIVNLYFEEFDQEIDIDELTTVDYTNLFAEIVTIPALMNRVGIWKAEAENILAESKLDLAIYESKRAEYYRKNLKTVVTDSKGNDKVKYATNPEIEETIVRDEGVILRKKRVIRLQKEAAYTDALYWAVKSKEMKINKLIEGMNLTPEDFQKQLVEGKFNGVLIKSKDKLIK